MENENLHSGHWQRFREKFLNPHFNPSEKEALELCLQYIFSRGDTNDLAARLLQKFKTFANVLNAKIDDLVEVKGISKTTAEKLVLLPKLFNLYNISNLSNEEMDLNCQEQCFKIAKKVFIGLNQEKFFMFCISKNGKLKKQVLLGQGPNSCEQISVTDMLKRAAENSSEFVLLAHNHVEGRAHPSDSDMNFTMRACQLFHLSGMKLVDHIIIYKNETYSFYNNGLIDLFLQKLK